MKSLYSKILHSLAIFQAKHPVLTLVLILTLTIAIYGGMSEVRTVASLEQMMPKDIEEIKAFNTLRDNNLGQDIIAIVIETDRESTDPNGVIDIRDKRVYDYIVHLQTLLQEETDILTVQAYPDLLDPQNVNDMTKAEYQELLQDTSLRASLEQFVNNDYTTTIILLMTDVAASDERMILLSQKIKQDVYSAGRPAGTRIKFTGTPIIQQKLGELIAQDRTNTRWISTLLVFIITMIIFRSFSSALVPIIVVTISVTWLYGTMGYVGLPISTLAGGVAAMVIGIGIDFAIHIMNKYKYERKKGKRIEEAVAQAVVETGTALTATSFTTMAAFLAFLVGLMPEMGRFGMLMAIGIAYSLLFSLFGLPALLILEDKFQQWMKNKTTTQPTRKRK